MSRYLVKIVFCLSLLGLLATTVWAQQQESPEKFTLSLTTRTELPMFEIPEMPDMGDLEGMEGMEGMPDMSDLMKLMDPSKPAFVISGDALYPHAAVDPIFVTVPKDLALAKNRLVLEVPKWIESPDMPTDPNAPEEPEDIQPMRFISKLYWHPEEAKGPVTNEVSTESGVMPTEQAINMQMFGNENYFEEIARTASGSESDLPEEVSGRGTYVLNTGGVTMPLEGFLPPIIVTEPKSLKEISFPAGFTVTWEPVEGARGYILHAQSFISDDPNLNMADEARTPAKKPNETVTTTNIQWVSTLKEPPTRVIGGYEQETTIQDDLDNGILLPADTISCIVPPNVFPEDPGMFTLKVIAVGNDFYSNVDGIRAFGKIRAEWSAMHMPGMEGMDMGGMGMEGMDEDMGELDGMHEDMGDEDMDEDMGDEDMDDMDGMDMDDFDLDDMDMDEIEFE